MFIVRSINLALKGRGDGTAGRSQDRFPWLGVEPAETLISELLSAASIPRSSLFKAGASRNRKIAAVLGRWSDEKLKALTTGHRAFNIGELIAEPQSVGPLIPPWEKPELTPEQIILECLRMLASPDFMDTIPAKRVPSPFPMAHFAVKQDHLLYETTWPMNGRRGREEEEKTWRSALLAPKGSLKDLAWSCRAYETWQNVLSRSAAYVKEYSNTYPEISAELSMISSQVAPTRSWIKTFLIRVEPLLENANPFYVRCWEKKWGPKKVKFLELLRSARRSGMAISDLKRACVGSDPSRLVDEMIDTGLPAEVKVGEKIKALRKPGRYYLYPD